MDHILTSEWLGFPPFNQSPANCSGDPYRESCFIAESEKAKRDLVAFVRSILSVLSLLGSLSIIISVIVKRQVFSPKIHPIFMLSIADCLLSLSWIVGGALWLVGGASQPESERVGCFTVMLCTVILECVAVNLTLVYALLAYSGIKQKDFNNVYLLFNRDRDVHAWKPWKTVLAYVLAWTAPAVLILVPFSSLASVFHILKHSNLCSCWCLPYYGNVLPLAFAADKPTAHYLYRIKMIVSSYSSVVGVNYLIGFICLFIIYWKVLRRIRLIRNTRSNRHQTSNQYGTLDQATILRGENQAKARVIAFLTVFIFVGFFNTFFSFAIFGSELSDLSQIQYTVPYEPTLSNYDLGIYLLQSVTLPLQGFLNAIVYGWTRGDFLHVMAGKNIQELPPNIPREEEEDEGLENSYSVIVASDSVRVDGTSHDYSAESHEHRPISHDFRYRPHDRYGGGLDTVDEVTEPEDDGFGSHPRMSVSV